MVGEIVQKHLPHMTACRRKKPLKSRVGNHPYIAFLPLFWKERYVPLREKALTFKAAFFIIFA